MTLYRSAVASLRKTLRSFRYAFRGLWLVFRYENNTRVHLVATLLALGLGLVLRLSLLEWAVVLTQIGLVWAAEAFNTAIEKVVDLVSPDYHPLAGKAKDIAAGAVLVIAIVAAIVGVLVYGPKLYQAFVP